MSDPKARRAKSRRRVRLRIGEASEVLASFPPGKVDAIVTDPPYGLGFMGEEWDRVSLAFAPEFWRIAARVLKPGGWILSFGGSRTYHRLACAVEDAGFEIRDQVMWIYGTGFPKSLDVAKAIAKTGEDARAWEGWGTALKPAHEPIVVARKALDGTVAANVLAHGTGAMNVDGCRIDYEDEDDQRKAEVPQPSFGSESGLVYHMKTGRGRNGERFDASRGRWPANVIHDGSPEVVDLFGKPARFFYCAKAGRKERDAGVEHRELTSPGEMTGGRAEGSAGLRSPRAGAGRTQGARNPHPTVKPIALMRYLVRLVTPPDGIVLDPFMGSGSTGVAAIEEGFRFLGIEREEDYARIAADRIRHALRARQK